MALKDVLKKGSGAPAPADLITGGIGVDTVNKRLYFKADDGTVVPHDRNTPAGNIVATTVQGAINELDTVKAPLASPTFTGTVNSANLAYTGTLTGGTGVVAIGTNQIVKDASGNVGIGTLLPNNKLTVGTPNSNGGSSCVASFSGVNVAALNTSGMVVITSTNSIAADIGGSIGFAANGTIMYPTGTIAGRRENATANNYASYMQFTTCSSAGTVSERMRIDSSGNVGININPSTKLTVAGAITITGAFALRGSYGGGAITANFAAGDGALVANTTGAYNTAVGVGALNANTSGGANTASGTYALQSNTTGGSNMASGTNALLNNTTGSYNTASGLAALRDNTTGSGNTASGQAALINNTTGSGNVGIGYGVASSTITVSNEVNIYNGTVTARFQGAAAAWSFVSDARDKSDIEPLTLGLEFITGLQPRKFKWDIRDCDVDKGKEASGFIAQEVLEVVEVCNAGYTGLVDTNNPDQYTVATGNLIPILVNAIKELTTRLKLLEGK